MSARNFSKALTALSAAALLAAAFDTLRLAWADALFRANTRASVSQAVRLDPESAAYHAWLAEIQEHDGDDPVPELESASKLNPSDSRVWIRRGLRAERDGDLGTAEQLLLRGAAIDKLYSPRWTLANFYARRGDSARFWPWARQAIEMGYGDLTPIFRLCRNVSRDPEPVLGPEIRNRPDVLRKLLAFLMREDSLDAAQPVARALLATALPEDAPVALWYCDRLLERNQAAEALEVWNALCARGAIPLAALRPESGAALTNGDFSREPLGQGFDWKIAALPEISVARAGPAGLRIRLSGRQPEHCEVLAQIAPLTPGARYAFRFEYRAGAARSGLRWRIGELGESPELTSAEWTRAEAPFDPRGASLTRLALVYDRAPGDMRAEGDFWIRNASLARSE
jgi:hypothetical protein